MDALNTVL